jgi:hypothetical protein
LHEVDEAESKAAGELVFFPQWEPGLSSANTATEVPPPACDPEFDRLCDELFLPYDYREKAKRLS